MSKKGKVYLVGAGPAGKDLITVRGLDILRQADIVIYDYLIQRYLLDEAKPGARLVNCGCLGKNHGGTAIDSQERINSLIISEAKKGKAVIRLKNGDVSIFSRLREELNSLIKENIEFELVPGVTSASAAASFTGIPLTDREYAPSAAFVTGHEVSGKKDNYIDWQALSKLPVLVLYMAVGNLGNVVKDLAAAGKDKNTNIAIIENAGRLNQRLLKGTLKTIVKKAKDNSFKPPAIIIMGKTAGFEKKFNWFVKSRKVLFTGISKPRYFQGKLFFYLPLIKILPLDNYVEFDKKLKAINTYDWIIFSSRYGVEYFFKRLNKIGLDARQFTCSKIAAIGKSTASRLLDFGIIADLAAKDESSKGLIKEFKKIGARDKKIFIPRSDLSDKGLEAAFKQLGGMVTASIAYKNVMPEDLPDLDLNIFDEIMFTSPSGVRNFINRYGKPPERIKINCIGEVTAKEAKKWNL